MTLDKLVDRILLLEQAFDEVTDAANEPRRERTYEDERDLLLESRE